MGLPEGQHPVNVLSPEDNSRGGSVVSPLKILANSVRNRKFCSMDCPFAEQCPLLPLSMSREETIVLENGKKKQPCKLKDAPPGVQRRIKNMFLNGEEGLITEIQSALFVAGTNLGSDPKERIAYADALGRLHKTIYGEKSKVSSSEPLDITVRQLVVQPDGTRQAQEVQLNKTQADKFIQQQNAARLLARNDPPPCPEENDPESLISSPVLDVIINRSKEDDIISYDMSEDDGES